MVDGTGDPNTSKEYANTIQALYPVAYAIKFHCKKALDFGVMPLEGLWWTENMAKFSMKDRNNWTWTAMIMQPKPVTADVVAEAVDQVRKKRIWLCSTAFASIRMMRVGPPRRSMSAPTPKRVRLFSRLHEFIAEQGGALWANSKHHHEIYLGDPRKTEPSKLKTIIRQPF